MAFSFSFSCKFPNEFSGICKLVVVIRYFWCQPEIVEEPLTLPGPRPPCSEGFTASRGLVENTAVAASDNARKAMKCGRRSLRISTRDHSADICRVLHDASAA